MNLDKKPTAKDVTINLYWSLRSASELLIPRFTPQGWWECDLWRLTKSEFVDEYEIKMTVADFRADIKKVKEHRFDIDPVTRRYVRLPSIAKHELLATAEGGPNRFWYVLPRELRDQVEIPRYAGLMLFSGHCRPCVEIQAPKRHTRKWTGDRLSMFSTFYHRYWNAEAGLKGDIPPSNEHVPRVDEEDAAIVL